MLHLFCKGVPFVSFLFSFLDFIAPITQFRKLKMSKCAPVNRITNFRQFQTWWREQCGVCESYCLCLRYFLCGYWATEDTSLLLSWDNSCSKAAEVFERSSETQSPSSSAWNWCFELFVEESCCCSFNSWTLGFTDNVFSSVLICHYQQGKEEMSIHSTSVRKVDGFEVVGNIWSPL